MLATAKQNKSNAFFALIQYNLALQWRWPLCKALTFAADECESVQDIDELQNLLNEQCAQNTINQAQTIAIRIINRS